MRKKVGVEILMKNTTVLEETSRNFLLPLVKRSEIASNRVKRRCDPNLDTFTYVSRKTRSCASLLYQS